MLWFIGIIFTIFIVRSLTIGERLGYGSLAILFIGAYNSNLAGALWAIAILAGITWLVYEHKKPIKKPKLKYVSPGQFQVLK